MKERFIRAYQWMYGSTKKEAEKEYRERSEESRKLIIACFEDNAKRSFYTD